MARNYSRTLIPLLLLCAPALFAQGTGSITGAVRDNTGAVIAKAEVTLTNTVTGTPLKTTTNAGGNICLPRFHPPLTILR